MRLVSFEGGFGRLERDRVIPMGQSLADYLTTRQVEEREPEAVESLRLQAPLPLPGKIVCVGLNYRDHAAESGAPVPESPVLFGKFANSVIGPDAPIELPKVAAEKVDYEAELGVVIGRSAREVPLDHALDHVAGYTCLNDVSARDLQFLSDQWLLGKAIDSFLPMGPSLVTADEIPDPHALGIRCLLNDEVVQASSTSEMIFGVAELVSFITRTITLEPGDIIATGTPAGVGFTRRPALFLQEGDVVSVEIDGIGRLTNPVRVRS
jgi:2-keto-4-pentenoate hydratase/2-oxohepta-3-ene-1,7-dioic acid hydratase in catechol pathway